MTANRLGEALRRLRAGASIEAMAPRLGVNKNTLGAYERGERLPDVDFLARFAAATGARFVELLRLRLEASRLAAAHDAASEFQPAGAGEAAAAAAEVPARAAGIPVMGLAECGLRGWYQEDAMAVRAARPGDLLDPEAFAVMAVGTSLQPLGVRPGVLCICSPGSGYGPGDVVYTLRRDATASLKQFVEAEAGWITLRGFLPADANGLQAPYTERLRESEIRRLAVVVYLKLKL